MTAETGQLLNTWITSRGCHLWGHGTPADDPGSFFDKGVITKSDGISSPLEDINSFALPIGVYGDPTESGQITNVDFMSDWPHKKYSSKPNVVILALPDAKPDEGIYIRDIMERLIDIDEGDNGFPPDLVVGFFNSATKEVLMNPRLTLSDDILDRQYETVQQRAEKTRSKIRSQLTPLLGIPPPEPSSPPATNKTDSVSADNLPDIW